MSALFGLVDRPRARARARGRGGATKTQRSRQPWIKRRKPRSSGEPFCVHLSALSEPSIAGLLFFWLLDLWGFEVQVGEQVTEAALKVLLNPFAGLALRGG